MSSVALSKATGHCMRAVAFAAAVNIVVVPALAQQFIAPPRTIADITAILHQEKPDAFRASAMRVMAEIEPSHAFSPTELVEFYYERCRSNAAIGELRRAIADCEKAEVSGRRVLSPAKLGLMRQGIAIQYEDAGDPKKALAVLHQLARDANVPGAKGWLFNTYRHLTENYILLGDFDQAEAYVKRSQALLQEAKNWPAYTGYNRMAWNADLEQSKGRFFEGRGQYADAERAYARAEALRRESIPLLSTLGEGLKVSPNQLKAATDELVALKGRMKARQGRIAEGEADVRSALLSRLKATGKYSVSSIKMIGQLANLMIEQGRFAEAEKLTRAQIDAQKAIGIARDSQSYASSLGQLASILNLMGRWEDAATIYDELDSATAGWEAARREGLQMNADHILTLYNTNNLKAGISSAERLVARHTQRLGDKHIDTALSRGLLGIGLAKSGRDTSALREFRLAVPILLARSREIDDDDATLAAAREQRAQIVIESYLALLARSGLAAGLDPATEGFPLADTLRGQAVQRALSASAARSAAATPALAEMARRAQDLDKQIGAQLGLLNNLLTLPPSERDEKAVKNLQTYIEKMRSFRDATKKELSGKFQSYVSLVEPTPPTAEDIRTLLRQDEAYLSFYFGREASFVWAVGKSGPISFAAIPTTSVDIGRKIQRLRAALEPEAALISDIPRFDTQLAHELYSLLLEPVEPGWKGAASLIVSTNGALGLLPLGLLLTAPADVKANEETLFAGYRNLPWLARSHATTLVPSAAALRTLRRLPEGSSRREQMVGFGDPLFSREQATAAIQTAEVTTRGLPLRRRSSAQTNGIDSAQLGLLPRLPDTNDELRSIATALQADPSKVLNLGKAANEEAVKTTDLSKFKVIVFATHGLVPGELDGLHQPALALSAPDVAGVSGDGLLTMEEILALKLDADWVVLSACNTGAGTGVAAEAASGLGRAFFYAGTRAILVTNWSVHSASARDLVSDLFARQTANPSLSRGEALRQAALGLLDGSGFTDAKGATLFSYAHPLFWAPYTIIGDGG
ncbi:CHAT domain-containing protein [Bradyrhizobium daqingense]|uniref:CHAT domain-containing protein n=2 Tax=Bradyrhizobium daqingense TaxID=993502 RepID=A0A562KXT8_9BRAD|nr:CHAT domain-containing protein [Bradyrhizobium daqingense]